MSAQKLFLMEKKILEMQDIQEQLDKSWDMDHAEHVETQCRFDFLVGKVHTLQRIVFWTYVLVVGLVLERLCVYLY
jgi:hypothetical protein